MIIPKDFDKTGNGETGMENRIMKMKTRTVELAGSSYEIGRMVGAMMKECPAMEAHHTTALPGFDGGKVREARQMFERWCPGLNEELEGCADALGVQVEQLAFWGMTSLCPNCSQIAVLPSKTKEGVPLLARNYEFHPDAEDFTLVRTSVAGKHSHLGTSVMSFGRDDGMNECGLAVTMSSCGFPVGPLEYMRKPQVKGLQFWAVIRSVLENCSDVEDALELLKEMPIAFNVNLMLMDRKGDVALVETVDGRVAVKRICPEGKETYLCATNHVVLPELLPYEPQAMRHSVVRLEWMKKQMDGAGKVGREDLKRMLHSMYPDGLCCHFFRDFFGTTKSMVISPVQGTIELCWGGEDANGWNLYQTSVPVEPSVGEIELHNIPFPQGIGDFIPLETGEKA